MKKPNLRALVPFLFFSLLIIYMECVTKVFSFGSLFDSGFDYILFFSLPIGVALGLVDAVVKKPWGRILSLGGLGLIGAWLTVQLVYISMFRSVLVVSTLGMAGTALSNYWRETLSGIWNCIVPIIL